MQSQSLVKNFSLLRNTPVQWCRCMQKRTKKLSFGVFASNRKFLKDNLCIQDECSLGVSTSHFNPTSKQKNKLWWSNGPDLLRCSMLSHYLLKKVSNPTASPKWSRNKKAQKLTAISVVWTCQTVNILSTGLPSLSDSNNIINSMPPWQSSH